MTTHVEPITIRNGLLGLAHGAGQFRFTLANRWSFLMDTRLDVTPAGRIPMDRWTRTFGSFRWSTHVFGTGPLVMELFGPPRLGFGTVLAVVVGPTTATVQLEQIVLAKRIVRAPSCLRIDANTNQTSEALHVFVEIRVFNRAVIRYEGNLK
jgi:hypothetical protein